jgi:hypothetical protein
LWRFPPFALTLYITVVQMLRIVWPWIAAFMRKRR